MLPGRATSGSWAARSIRSTSATWRSPRRRARSSGSSGYRAVAPWGRGGLGFERILFVPAGQPPHKPAREVSAIEHRVAMVELAIADNPAFELSRIKGD